ncbi:MAG: hypothetical protein ACJA08_000212 [Cyclobacteriaceae bacterium]|jgi:hypothetical protein
MSIKELYIGDIILKNDHSKTEGSYIKIEGEEFYKISNYDLMRPFFISLVSHSDHWMFISTTGGLSAGRKNSNAALFPYYTDDKISENYDTIGSKTILRVNNGDKISLWEPFTSRYQGSYSITRNLYKNFTGNKLIFEEVNADLGLNFQYSWQFSEKYGIVKRATILNTGNKKTSIEVLDGIQNIVPSGINSDFQNRTSNLINAYKKNELDEASGLGLFMLSAMIVDKAEPSEALKTTTIWNVGIECENILLTSLQLNKYRQGADLITERDTKAESGSYFINSHINLSSNVSSTWYIIGEVNQDHSKVITLINKLTKDKSGLYQDLIEDVESGTQSLLQLVAKADGLQLTADKLSVSRHYANVLFNVMRGGIFDDQYLVEKSDLLDYVLNINKKLLLAEARFFDQLSETLNYQHLIKLAHDSANADIIRICYEYLPLTFSRRHGDPSRPWNMFSIVTKNDDGSKKRSYEGNWRDIFQNWEALSVSFPGYIISMITKFVNASTIDGYNPYRVTRNGIDWEIIEPDDPWSYIGYWGDHQIIYLQKLMEVAVSHHKDEFLELLAKPIYVYANVPYRIKGYDDIIKDPQDTIDFNQNVESKVESRVHEIGGDGKLVFDQKGRLTRANLTEKLLVTLLAKLSNFIPEGGIWLNTQRPEWNDANNALVGNGVSMVTLCYMRRYVSFCLDLFTKTKIVEFEINKPVSTLFKEISNVFESRKSLLDGVISDSNRRLIVDQLGRLGEQYRSTAYAGFDGDTDKISSVELIAFMNLTLSYLDHTIKANKRVDGLYHAYNLIQFSDDTASIDNLYEMLEGQVAVLSAGVLNLDEALKVLDALKQSKIYRADQYSYMLYPNRELPTFLNKNYIPKDFAEQSALAQSLIAAGDSSLIQKDENGDYHFNGSFNNAKSLKAVLDILKNSSFGALIQKEYDAYMAVFETMFNHKAFTGRSGTFFGYEGLGSIYWHMVSKLLLAAQENIYWSGSEYEGTVTMGKMVDHYYEIRAGIGANKSPELYGSFPTDPYSHTPGNKGVQQPGMTGQVKEDILNRWAEFGVRVQDSCISFEQKFLSKNEFLIEPTVFNYFDLNGSLKSLELKTGELAFTYGQVPVIYCKSDSVTIKVHFSDGSIKEIKGTQLPKDLSNEIFNRTNSISKVIVFQHF